MKIKIIYGAPCSGKTTYCKEHIEKDDIVYDYDQLSKALKYSDAHKITREEAHDFVIDFRLAILKRIKSDKERKGNCYFIVTNLTNQLLNFIEDCDYEIIEMETSKEECLERLENDDREDKEKWKEKIEEWFKKKEGKKMKEENKAKANREYRNMELSVRSAEGKNDEMIVEGYATTFNDPYLLFDDGTYRVFEQVSPKAFDNCDMNDVIMQYDHNGRVFARTKNKTLELSVDDKGLFVRANLGGTDEGRKLYQEIKNGYTDKMSFGFIVKTDERTNKIDYSTGIETVTRTITEISKLYDVSAVSIPANDMTSISARSFSDGVIAELSTERLKRARLKLKIKLMED